MKKNIINSIYLFLFYFIIIFYLEILFKMRVLSLDFNIELFRIALFSLSYTIMIMFILMFFKEKTAKITSYVLVSIITFMYFNQEIYSSFVEGFYSFSVAGDFTAGLSFFSDYFTAFRFGHISYLVPIIAVVLFSRNKVLSYEIEYCTLKMPLVVLVFGALFFFFSLQSIDETVELQEEDQNEDVTIENVGTLISYSDMDLYNHMYNNQEAIKKFGLLTYTQRDFFNLFRTDPLSEQAYEVLIDDFYSNNGTHEDNMYTGLYEDKNFILIMAESFDTYAISEELTPNLYALKQGNAYFENYYSPLYYRSTADSEFLVQTSMFPDKNVTLSMEAYMNNTFPMTFPKLFEESGYSTYSFHNYFDYFYPRGDFHINGLGYDQFWGSEELGITSGFDPDGNPIFDHVWESDYELMQKAIPKFINEDKFFVNLLTLSGHFQYSDNHEMARPEYVEKAREYLENLEEPVEYSDEIVYYLAVHMEVDKAIGYLIDQLEEANKMDDTVIMIFGDHYAYGIDNEDIWAYDNEYKNDFDELDIHNVPMMIISESSVLTSATETYFSTIDIMPTIANLFDLDMDYSLVFGHDALGEDNNIVRFADGSFISEDFRYDSMSDDYTIYNDAWTRTQLHAINNTYINNYMYDILVLEYDYFKEKE